jgi:hypothetical protein
MRGSESPLIDVGALLEKVEAAAPIDAVEAALAENAAPGQFVTGQLMRVDLHAGTAAIVTAGHPFPLRLRHGRVAEIDLRIEAPFGVLPGKSFDIQPLSLEPGDRIVLLTDGKQERNAVDLDVATALGAAVLDATGGNLSDDATMVRLDWYGGPPRGRNTEQGADPDRASAALLPVRAG